MTVPSLPSRYAQPGLAGVASLVGTTIEWYDFFLYGTAAALIFNRLFFPNFEPRVGTLASFATYSVGFLARPLGGMLFGHYGDRVGRKSMLLITLFLMGVPTTLIGLVPTYEQIGIWAPTLLVLLRFLQGIAIGGEWGGAALMAVEHAPAARRGFFGSLPQAGVGVGLVLSSLAVSWMSGMPDAALMRWGWRMPFLASIGLLGVGAFIRIRVAESPEFRDLRSTGGRLRSPLLAVFRHAPLVTLRMMGARLTEATWFYTVVTFALAYSVNELALPKGMILDAIVAGAALAMLTIPALGHLSDRIDPRGLAALGAFGVAAFAFPFFRMLQTREVALVWLAIVPALGVVHALMYSQQATLFAAQFPAAMRYSGISLVVQVPAAIGGGLAPLIASGLLALDRGSTGYLSAYLLTLGVLAFLCSATLTKRPAP